MQKRGGIEHAIQSSCQVVKAKKVRAASFLMAILKQGAILEVIELPATLGFFPMAGTSHSNGSVIFPVSMPIWVCLKIGYITNYSHLIGIMIINHWVQWGTLFSDKPISGISLSEED